MNELDTRYLAGFLEGEGCFTINTRKEGWKSYARITTGSTDKDVLVKAQQLSGGLGNVFSRKMPPPDKSHWKQCHVWNVDRIEAIELMEAILPYMGERRSNRIREVLKSTRKD